MRKIGILLASALVFVAVGCGSDSTSSPKPDGSAPDGAATPGVDSGIVNPGVDGPVAPAVDAAVVPDAPAVLDAAAVDSSGIDAANVVLDAGKGIDGTQAFDGGKGIDGGKAVDGGAMACANMPSCLAGIAGCVPQGTCRVQTDVTAGTNTTCYDNGVKLIQQTGTAGISITAKNGSAVCYAMALDYATILSGGPISLKDGAGTLLATLTVSPAVDGGTQQISVLCPGATQAVVLDPACTGAVAVGTTSSSNCTAGTCP
jgi:hypothetical protein